MSFAKLLDLVTSGSIEIHSSVTMERYFLCQSWFSHLQFNWILSCSWVVRCRGRSFWVTFFICFTWTYLFRKQNLHLFCPWSYQRFYSPIITFVLLILLLLQHTVRYWLLYRAAAEGCVVASDKGIRTLVFLFTYFSCILPSCQCFIHSCTFFRDFSEVSCEVWMNYEKWLTV